MEEPFRLHPEPQLELVRGQGGEVQGEVVGGAGVDHRGAFPGVDLVELVLDDQLGLPLLELGEPGAELGEARGLVLRIVDAAGEGAAPLGLAEDLVLGFHLRPDRVELAHDGPLGLVVGGADGRGPLEHHVLEEVGDPGRAVGLVGRADVSDPAGGDGGGFRAFDQQQPHSVVEGDLPDRDPGVLGADRRGQVEGGDDGEDGGEVSGFHARAPFIVRRDARVRYAPAVSWVRKLAADAVEIRIGRFPRSARPRNARRRPSMPPDDGSGRPVI